MELSGQTLLPAPPEAAWALLHDPQRLQAALPGCEFLRAGEQIGQYHAALQLRIGPLQARFQAQLLLDELQPPRRYRLRAQAQGGAAGHGRGEAEVELHPEGAAATRLHYRAQFQVGGRLAQLGARLIEPAAQQLSQNFFAALAVQLAASPAPAARPWWRRCWDWLCGRSLQ